jgi:FkbM family methyltransferase
MASFPLFENVYSDMIEMLKSLGRSAVRCYIQSPLRGKSRLRALTDQILKPTGNVEKVKVGPCSIMLNHEHEATRNMAYGAYENTELKLIRKIVSKGDTVIDIGANVGYFSAHLADNVGPKGRVIAVEPGSTPLEILRQTASNNRFQNIEVVPCAIGGRTGKAIFFETEVILAKGYGRIDDRPSDKFEEIREYEVDILTPEHLFEKFAVNCPSFIKIDVEGQEKNVVYGFETIFRRGCFPTLMTEVTIESKWRDDLTEYSVFLQGFGYNMHRVVAGFPKISVNDLRPGFHGNVFWLPSQFTKNSPCVLPR